MSVPVSSSGSGVRTMRRAVMPMMTAVSTISQCPSPGTTCDRREPAIAPATPTGAVPATTCQSTSRSRW